MSGNDSITPKFNNSKGIKAILRGTCKPVTRKKKLFQYTLQQKKSMITEYDSSPNFYGKLKQFNERFSVADGFLKKARASIDALERSVGNRGLLARINGPELDISSKRKTISIGKKVRYPIEEDWLYLQYQNYRTHEIAISTTLLICLIIGKFPILGNINDDKMKQWMYRWQQRFRVTTRRVTHSHQNDEQDIGEIRVDFIEFYREIVSEYNLAPTLIINMDETACDLADSITTTLATKGDKQVPVKLFIYFRLNYLLICQLVSLSYWQSLLMDLCFLH
jgi:hypothetical protein